MPKLKNPCLLIRKVDHCDALKGQAGNRYLSPSNCSTMGEEAKRFNLSLFSKYIRLTSDTFFRLNINFLFLNIYNNFFAMFV